MRRTWIHPEYSIASSVPQAASSNCAVAAKQFDAITYFLILSLTSLLFGAALILVYSGTSQLPFFKHDGSNSFDRPLSISSWSSAIFGDASKEQKNLTHQTAKLRQIILKSGHIRDPEAASDLARSIVIESASLNYDPFFVASVIKHESGFNRHAVSRVGAQGLMQIMPSTARYIANQNRERWLGWWRLRDPQYNLRLGITYLIQLEKQFKGNRELALIAYNWGPNNVIAAKNGKARVPSSSMRYARAVLSVHRKWKSTDGALV